MCICEHGQCMWISVFCLSSIKQSCSGTDELQTNQLAHCLISIAGVCVRTVVVLGILHLSPQVTYRSRCEIALNLQ